MEDLARSTPVGTPRVAVVGIVGRTNAGKSTLVNRLVGEKISIVSPVEQTTRNTVRGIVADPRGQLVLLDTPGLHKAEGRLGTLLNRMARRSAAGVDVLCVVFDASQEPQMEDVGWMKRVAKERPPKVVFALNKADKKPFFETMYREAWEEVLRETPAENADGPATIPLEPCWTKAIATTEGGEKAVLEALFAYAEPGEPLFPEDIVTDYPRRLTIADVIREKFLARLHQEIPHELGVCVKTIHEQEDRWDVKVDVLVNRASQKPIVIGRGAEILKNVRKSAERELREIFGLKVALEMWVRVEPKWMENSRLLAEMGYLGGEI
ncbi:MAG TPA: GTPase Era [Verrucomicrobia bacterium]|nr:GTPase Era [Verrucomicrobiota bacterium]